MRVGFKSPYASLRIDRARLYAPRWPASRCAGGRPRRFTKAPDESNDSGLHEIGLNLFLPDFFCEAFLDKKRSVARTDPSCPNLCLPLASCILQNGHFESRTYVYTTGKSRVVSYSLESRNAILHNSNSCT